MYLDTEKQNGIENNYNDRSDYPFGKTPWVLIIGAGPLLIKLLLE